MNPMQNNGKEIRILTYSKTEKFQEKGNTLKVIQEKSQIIYKKKTKRKVYFFNNGIQRTRE